MQRVPAATFSRRLRILLWVFEAGAEALAAGVDIWQFAVPLEALRGAGVTHGDLRWLEVSGYAEFQIERTKSPAGLRRFRASARLDFRAGTCFVLTDSGRRLCERCLCGLDGDAGAVPHSAPSWNSAIGQLLFQGELIKELHPDATAQRAILSAFEANAWAQEMANPLWESAGAAGGRRPNTIRHVLARLNQQRNGMHVHFGMREKGR